MHHLHRVTEYSEHNNMPPSNLGIVFGPTLLRTSEGSASLSSLIDTVHQTRVIELLITYAYEIFGAPSKSTSSQKEDIPSHKPKSKSCRYRGGKQALSRTVSGSSQTSDIEESHFIEVDHRRDGIPNLDDYPIPGYLPPDKSLESSHHNSDVTHSSDDLLYSNILSDDDFPEIMLPEDSVFKKSLQPSISNSLSDPKSNCDSSKSGQSSMHMKVHDTRASLSSSPAVSEGSHCSSLLRSTDDESISDIAWKDNILPVLPPRKNTPANLQLNQSFLHSSLDRKQVSSMSESSGVSSAASTSPTNAVDTSQSDPGNLYTSTAVVTLAGQKSPTQGAKVTASSTAELRRQFFELPPPLPTGTPPLTSRPSSQTETTKYSSESGRDSESSLSCSDMATSTKGTYSDVDCVSVCSKREIEPYPIQGPSTRPRGSSLSYASVIDSVSSNSFYGREDTTSGSAEISYSLKMESQQTYDVEKGIDSVDCRAYSVNKSDKSSQSDSKKRTEVISVKHMVQNIDLNPRSAISSDYECLNSIVTSKKIIECSTISASSILNESELKSIKSGDKLSPNRQPRFV